MLIGERNLDYMKQTISPPNRHLAFQSLVVIMLFVYFSRRLLAFRDVFLQNYTLKLVNYILACAWKRLYLLDLHDFTSGNHNKQNVSKK